MNERFKLCPIFYQFPFLNGAIQPLLCPEAVNFKTPVNLCAYKFFNMCTGTPLVWMVISFFLLNIFIFVLFSDEKQLYAAVNIFLEYHLQVKQIIPVIPAVYMTVSIDN